MKLHPLCELFPALVGDEFEALVADIRGHGLHEPIVVFGDQVLDGRNRLRACLAANVEPRYAMFTGDDPAAFVLSKNLYRRHLPQSQSAAIVASAQDWSRVHRRGGTGANQHRSRSANLPISNLSTVAGRARMAGVSVRLQSMADRVHRENRELAEVVRNGSISVQKAVRLLDQQKNAALDDSAVVPSLTPSVAAEPSPVPVQRAACSASSTADTATDDLAKSDREARLLAAAREWREQAGVMRMRACQALRGKRQAQRSARHWKRIAFAPIRGDGTT